MIDYGEQLGAALAIFLEVSKMSESVSPPVSCLEHERFVSVLRVKQTEGWSLTAFT